MLLYSTAHYEFRNSRDCLNTEKADTLVLSIRVIRFQKLSDICRGGILSPGNGCGVSTTGEKTKEYGRKARDAHSAAELFIDSVPSILIGVDAQGLINRWNRAAAETFGIEDTVVLGKRLSNCGIHWLNSEIDSTISDLLRSPRRFVWDGMQFEKNGEPRLLGMTVNWIDIPDSNRGGLLIVGSDITFRKRTEDELRAKTAFFEAQTQATIDGLLVVDENAKILLHNDRFREIFEIPQDLFKSSDDNPLRTCSWEGAGLQWLCGESEVPLLS